VKLVVPVQPAVGVKTTAPVEALRFESAPLAGLDVVANVRGVPSASEPCS
jgi:hypothetical protein